MSIYPTKNLYATVVSSYDYEQWFDSANPDMWEGTTYKWAVKLNVTPQTHSADFTRVPFNYNAEDIEVGNWVGDGGGRALKIVEIQNSTDTIIDLIVEDVDRFNLFNDPNITGFGGIATPFVVVFDMNDKGLPDLLAIPGGYFNVESISALNSRFESRDYLTNYVRVYQTNNGFSLGDFIRVDPDNAGRYELCASNEINLAIGIVDSVNTPGTDWFTFRPLTEILENVQPPLVGAYGDIFYMDPDNPGKVTSTKPATNAKPVYIRLENEHRAVRLNAIVDMDTIVGTYKVASLTQDQTMFTMPEGTTDVIDMSINGIENKNFTYDLATRTLVFDPVATGYGIDFDDQVIFTYETQK